MRSACGRGPGPVDQLRASGQSRPEQCGFLLLMRRFRLRPVRRNLPGCIGNRACPVRAATATEAQHGNSVCGSARCAGRGRPPAAALDTAAQIAQALCAPGAGKESIMNIVLPDGSDRGAAPTAPPSPTWPPPSAPASRRAALAGIVNGTRRRLGRRPSPTANSVAIVTAKSDEGLELMRHSTATSPGRRSHRSVPRREVRRRPGHRERLLLRHRAARGRDRLAGRLRRHRGPHGRDRQVRPPPSPVARSRRDEAREIFADQPLQARAHRRAARGRGHLHLPARRLHRPVPRAARARHRQARRLQAHQGGRRLLEGRLGQRDAHPHLRHGVLQQEGAGGVPAQPGGGREARPPQARAASWAST